MLKNKLTISLILPTRKRPVEALNFLKSAFIRSEDPSNVEVVLYVDEDDGSYDLFESPFHQTLIIRGPRKTMSEYNRLCIEKSTGEIIFLVNDDVSVETFGWDREVRSIHLESDDLLYLCFPNDCFKQQKLSVFPIFSRISYDNFHLLPEVYQGAFIDTHIHEIFNFLSGLGYNRIRYLANVIFRHNHYRVEKKIPDETYTNRDRFADDLVFLRNVKNRHQTALALKTFIEEKALPRNKESCDLPLLSVGSALSYYLFNVPQDLFYRASVFTALVLRLIYKNIF